MLEEKKKREEKAAKANQFRARIEAVLEEGSAEEVLLQGLVSPTAEAPASSAPSAMHARSVPASVGLGGELVQVARNVVLRRPSRERVSDEQLKARIAAMVESRTHVIHKGQHGGQSQSSSPGNMFGMSSGPGTGAAASNTISRRGHTSTPDRL